MVIHLLSGFLGSGKTTTIRQACTILQRQGSNVAVVTNDQGVNIVDSRLFGYMQVPQKQVGNGCFCCNYDELDARIHELITDYRPDVIFAESVGTCTDIVATVMKPLITLNKATVTISAVVDAGLLYATVILQEKVFAEDVQYIFFKQLEEADIIVVNKKDLLNEEQFSRLTRYVADNYGAKTLIFQNSLEKGGVADWLAAAEAVATTGRSLQSLDIDYDQYASGEAMLAYYDGEVVVQDSTGNAELRAFGLWNEIVKKVIDTKLAAGHVKCWLNNRIKISYTSTTNDSETFNALQCEAAESATLLINARVQTDPETLGSLIDQAIQTAGADPNVKIHQSERSVFSPGYPRPVHRVSEAVNIS